MTFSHIVFPRERKRQRVIDIAAPDEGCLHASAEGRNLSREQASFFLRLFAQAGLDARMYRSETLERRLPACLRALRAQSIAHARRLLDANPGLVPVAVTAMLVGVTYFFRDQPVFESLRREVLPALAGPRGGLYVWSAGCSEGAELYSVAILLSEMGLLRKSYLLGTDCRPDALETARTGSFDSAALKNLTLDLLDRHFIRGSGQWQVAPALRQSARWRTADVLKAHEPGLWDLILFRNTAMYLKPEATPALWERFEQCLRPGGVLVLGKAERPVGAKRLSLLGHCMYRRNRR